MINAPEILRMYLRKKVNLLSYYSPIEYNNAMILLYSCELYSYALKCSLTQRYVLYNQNIHIDSFMDYTYS